MSPMLTGVGEPSWWASPHIGADVTLARAALTAFRTLADDFSQRGGGT
jgi:hypothetical protein